MRTTFTNIEEAQKAFSILFKAFLAGIAGFASIVIFLAPTHKFILSFSEPFTWVALLLTAVLIPAGHFAFQKFIAQACEADDIGTKLELYRKGFIFRCATLEGPCLFSIICTFLTNDFAYYIFLAIALAVFVTVNPTLVRMKQQLEIVD